MFFFCRSLPVCIGYRPKCQEEQVLWSWISTMSMWPCCAFVSLKYWSFSPFFNSNIKNILVNMCLQKTMNNQSTQAILCVFNVVIHNPQRLIFFTLFCAAPRRHIVAMGSWGYWVFNSGIFSDGGWAYQVCWVKQHGSSPGIIRSLKTNTGEFAESLVSY